jgi:Kdo2-lipid IVA lauroyltransferase/acyltransferase
VQKLLEHHGYRPTESDSHSVKKIKWILEFLALKTLMVVSRCIPSSKRTQLGRKLGRFVYKRLKFRRSVVEENLRFAFPNSAKSVGQLADKVYQNLGVTLLEFLSMDNLTPKSILNQVEFDGIHHLHDFKKSGQGVLLTTGHFGNWEMLAASINASGINGHYVVRSQSNPYVDKLQNDIRVSAGLKVIKAEDIRPLVKALRAGDLVGILPDVHAGDNGVIVDFMNRKASTTKGLAYFAWKFNCPIVPSAIFRKEDGGFKAIFKAPIYPDPDMSEEEAVYSLTVAHTAALEEFIRQQPDHYFWVHRRWKINSGKI